MIDIVYRIDPDRPVARPHPPDAAAARRLLEEGNREFATLLDPGASQAGPRILLLDPADLGGGAAGKVPTQTPFAAVLGCADARVPIELVFQRGANDLFVVRVAGHVLGTECLGSLHYALHHFTRSLRLLVVLSHSQCGAVTAAVDAFLTPRAYLHMAASFPLRSIIDRLLIGVRGASMALELTHGAVVAEQPGYRAALIETAIVFNAAWTAFSLQAELRGGPAGVEVVYGLYDLATRRVGVPLADRPGPDGVDSALLVPPRDTEAFRELGCAVAGSDQIHALLAGTPATRA
jgi:carbonic anhydrase